MHFFYPTSDPEYLSQELSTFRQPSCPKMKPFLKRFAGLKYLGKNDPGLYGISRNPMGCGWEGSNPHTGGGVLNPHHQASLFAFLRPLLGQNFPIIPCSAVVGGVDPPLPPMWGGLTSPTRPFPYSTGITPLCIFSIMTKRASRFLILGSYYHYCTDWLVRLEIS